MAKILLAEDDAAMRKFLTTALNKAGHEVTACINGIEALDTLKENSAFDLLLADIVMPGMDGIELSQRAGELHPDIKVMFITGFAAVALGHRNPEKTNARILSKPFHLNDLIGQINNILTA